MGRPKKRFSLRVGEVGCSVTLFERHVGGPLWIRYWTPGVNGEAGIPKWVALKHTDRTIGEKTAREVAAALLTSTLAAAEKKTTIAEVLTAYERDVANHSKGYGPREARRRIALWTQVLGSARHVDTIDRPLLDGFCRDRRGGAITLAGHKLGAKPSNRAVAADLEFLRAALNHACAAKRANGQPLLASNPMGHGKTGYKLPINRVKKRPLVSFDRFEKILTHADAIDRQHLFGGFMMLVEGLGWRVSAICQLRARDVDLKATPTAPHGRVFKRPETDKEERGGWVPMSASVRAGVDRVRVVNPAIGDWPLFPAPRATVPAPNGEIPKPWTRHYARALLERAEKRAKLSKVDGGDFHPYRRKWATERKHLPDVDVANAGGWSQDTRALKASYQRVDEATMLAVVSEPTKLRDAKAENRAETA